jgi:hypothetical protein
MVQNAPLAFFAAKLPPLMTLMALMYTHQKLNSSMLFLLKIKGAPSLTSTTDDTDGTDVHSIKN